jgi:hypothetical protein
MKKIRAAAFFCTVIFALGVFAVQNPTAQPNSGQMPSTQSPQGTPSTMPQQSAPPSQSAPQPSQGRMSNTDDQVKALSDQLNLNADQQSKVRSILMDQHDQAMALIQDNSMARDAKLEKIHSLRASTISKVREVLKDDQKTKFDQMVQQQDEHIRQQQQSGSNASPGSTSPSNAPASNAPAGNPPSGAKPPR